MLSKLEAERTGTPRGRDAARSRAAILEAAEDLFAQRGYDRASLQEIAAAAGLSRATPSYFFGSKEALYEAVLERVFAARERSVSEAFAPLREWAEGERGGPLRPVLAHAVEGYLEFLLGRPQFVRLVEWEALAGGRRLARSPHESRAAERAFRELRSAARGRPGLRAFDVQQALVCFVSLCFLPVAQQDTFLRRLGMQLDDPGTRRRHVRLVVDVLRGMVEKGV